MNVEQQHKPFEIFFRSIPFQRSMMTIQRVRIGRPMILVRYLNGDRRRKRKRKIDQFFFFLYRKKILLIRNLLAMRSFSPQAFLFRSLTNFDFALDLLFQLMTNQVRQKRKKNCLFCFRITLRWLKKKILIEFLQCDQQKAAAKRRKKKTCLFSPLFC